MTDLNKAVVNRYSHIELTDKINQSILDGEDANSGTKKIISDLFGSSQVTSQSIEEAIRKITEN